MDQKLITYQQVAKHNKPDDVWIIIYDHVYDPTPYLNQHPGGPVVLKSRAGKEVTKSFIQARHPKQVQEMMKKFRVGKLDQSIIPEKWQLEPQQNISKFRFLILGIIPLIICYYIYR